MKFSQKTIQTIIILLFVVLFSIFFSKEYLENYTKNNSEIKHNNILKYNISSFEVSKIKNLEKVEFYYTPYKPLLDKIVKKIDDAKNKIYLEVYMLTETRIKQALISAKKRWIDIKILLEKNPYKANNINNKHYKFLSDNDIKIKWSNPDNYILNHSKFMIIDDEIIVSTWNFTYSTFAYNRDMFLFISDMKLLNKLNELFEKDFIWEKTSLYDNNLVISPSDSRDKFSKLFDSAKGDIKMYFQYLKDEKLEDILIKKAEKWINIEILVSESFYLEEKQKIKELAIKSIKIKPLKKAKMHSKAILIDDKYLFIWSINFSDYSLDKNREIWILLTNQAIIKEFNELFEKDFAK